MSNTAETTTEQTTLEETTIDSNSIEETTANASQNTQNTTNPGSEESSEVQTNAEGEVLETSTEVSTSNGDTSTGMSIPFIGLSVLQCVIAFLLIIVVLQQSKTASSMASSAFSGAAADTESYWNKNKGRSKEGKLSRITIILGVIFFIITLILGFIK